MKIEYSTKLAGEEIGSLGVSGLRLALKLCYANFVIYLLLYITGMYVNVFVTSGVNTIGINDLSDMIHMIAGTLNFAFTFIVMVIGFLA